MSSYISIHMRQFVVKRAFHRCEYCHFPEKIALFSFEIEHIIAEKHGGKTVVENLALACFFCNRYKGSDLGSLDPESGILTPFFNPRLHQWDEHFLLEDSIIVPLSAEGRVTVRILRMNDPDRVAERKTVIETGLFEK